MSKTAISCTALVVGVILFFAVNILGASSLRSLRLDLTEQKLYSLSDGTHNIVSTLDEPIHLYLYYSEGLTEDIAAIKNYGTRVRELLEEYVLISGDKLVLEVLDPEPFSELEDEAVQAGIAGIPLPTGDSLYFGLVASNSIGDHEVLPFFDPGKEAFLEYDLTNLIYTLDHSDRRTVGVLSTLPLEGAAPPPPTNPMMRPQGGTPPWQVLSQMQKLYDVQMLATNVEHIPDDVDVLFIVHPKNLSDGTLYAIDQFVLRGGGLIAFVDPRCEEDRPPPDPSNPMAGMQYERASTLGPLFEAWGLELVADTVAGDRKLALPVRVPGSGGRNEALDYVVWMDLNGKQASPDDTDTFNRDEAVTGQLTRMMVPTAGVLKARSGATTEFTTLLSTSKSATQIATSQLMFPDPKSLLASYLPMGQALTLAARVTGPVETAFPGGPPEGYLPAEGEEQRTHSSEPAKLVVVADADLLADQWWISEVNFGGVSLGFNKQADNGDFVLNAVEQLCGNSDLISIRGRGIAHRPLVRIEEIREEADQVYLSQQRELEAKLRETEAKLNELQSSDPGAQSSLILSPAQQAELEKFQAERVATRKKLRDVQLNKQKDIERLGTKLKLANILGVPSLVALFAVALGIVRVRNRKA